MTEERITEVETPSGNTHTSTTVVHDEPRSGGAGTWMILLVLIVLGGLAVLAFMNWSNSEVVENNAIAGAAEDVGDAAGQVGDAAQEAADNLSQ